MLISGNRNRESVLGIIGTFLGLLAGIGIAQYTMVAAVNPTHGAVLTLQNGRPVFFSIDNLVTAVIMGIGITVLSGWCRLVPAARFHRWRHCVPQVGADIERATRGARLDRRRTSSWHRYSFGMGKETTPSPRRYCSSQLDLCWVVPFPHSSISRGFGCSAFVDLQPGKADCAWKILPQSGRSAVTSGGVDDRAALVISIFTLVSRTSPSSSITWIRDSGG
jgi:hypothetical protein